jgi:hypothetical protein
VSNASRDSNIVPRHHSQDLLLSELSEGLILEAKENLHDLVKRADRILYDLKLFGVCEVPSEMLPASIRLSSSRVL